MSDTVAGLVDGNEELAGLVFGDALGLLDWHAAGTAPERLQALAVVAPALAVHDRRDFRKEYRRAWLDLTKMDARLPRGLDLVVSRNGRLETLEGDAATAPTVIVTQNAQAFEARILSSAGHALLDIGDAPSEGVTERLAATGRFTPRQLDGVGVQILVDGEPFVPRTSDPLLTSLELGWLPEVVLLGHEILGERLERGVQPITIERRIQAIRVRRCQAIALVVDQDDVSPTDNMAWYGFEHPELPTLILSDHVRLTRMTLGRDLSRTVSQLIDKRTDVFEHRMTRFSPYTACGHLRDASRRPVIAPQRRYPIESAKVERKTGTIIHDVIVQVSGHRLLVEVTVTHGVDDAKLTKIRELGLSCLEIDLTSTEGAAGERFARRRGGARMTRT